MTGLLQGCSIEITAAEQSALVAAASLLRPAMRVNLTYLAGEDEALRVQAAVQIRRLGLQPLPHLSARRLPSEAAAQSYLTALREQADVAGIFVVGGDLPVPAGPYGDAVTLIRSASVAAAGLRLIGIAGYPDGHPTIAEAALWQSLHDKHRAVLAQGLRCEIITQFSFDADRVLLWLERLRERGIAVPVRIGIAGPARATTLMRYAARCGVAASAGLLRKYGVGLTRLFDGEAPTRFVERLGERLDPFRHGEVALHIYPFGGIERTLRWLQPAP